MLHSMQEIEVRYYVARNGRAPFIDWIERLTDKETRARIKVRIDRLMRGLFGDTRGVGDGVEELRIHGGAGYRIYYGRTGPKAVLLLYGGVKDRQPRDIGHAKAYWRDFLERQDEETEEEEPDSDEER